MQADNDSIAMIMDAQEDGRLELTEWEQDFMDSVFEQIEASRELSVKQRQVIGRIQEKIRAW